MKYGYELQESVFAPWRMSYIAYDVLKLELKTRQLDHEWNDQDEADFVQVGRCIKLELCTTFLRLILRNAVSCLPLATAQ